MNDLFSDLYRYRQREKKNSLEDWLTECVAAIIRALPKLVFAGFISRLTGEPAELIADVHDYITVASQVTIGRGTTGLQRPDLVISIDAPEKEGKKEPRQPWLLFENKVFHHLDEQELGTGKIENQLHRYGNWLREQPFDRPDLKQTLVFITHGTPAPTDFKGTGPSHPAFGDLGRVSKTWGSIADLLADVSADYDSNLHFTALINAFKHFLKEHGMADEYPEYRDYAALAGFIETVEPFEKLVNEMFGKLDGIAPFHGHVVWASTDAQEGTFSAYRFLAKDDRYDEYTYLATGIWFPDRGERLYSEELEKAGDTPVSFSPKVYIQLANREDDALTALVGRPEGHWYRLNSNFFTFRDITSFPPEPAEAAASILQWVETEGAKLKDSIGRLSQR